MGGICADMLMEARLGCQQGDQMLISLDSRRCQVGTKVGTKVGT